MDLTFYGFARAPFASAPDPASLFAADAHRAAFAELLESVQARRGFATFVAEIGLGKTTLARLLAQHLDPAAYRVIYVFNPPSQLADPIAGLLREFGEDGAGLDPMQRHDALARHLVECYRQRQTVVLIIDEAHTLTPERLESLRLLSNLEAPDEKLLHIVLVGQPELDEMLLRPDLRQLRQRVAAQCRLAPLTRSESIEYLLFRMRRAGLAEPGRVLTRPAVREIARAGRGVPRLLNIAAERVLAEGSRARRRRIRGRAARRALTGVSAAPRTRGRTRLMAGLALTMTALLGLGLWADGGPTNLAWLPAGLTQAIDRITIAARG